MVVCLHCRFELYKPIATLDYSTIGLYNDARFPGRLLQPFTKRHVEALEELTVSEVTGFITEVQKISRILKEVTKSPRINVAFLGNSVPHSHAHLIPRYPNREVFPGSSPWNDPRRLSVLPDKEIEGLVARILKRL